MDIIIEPQSHTYQIVYHNFTVYSYVPHKMYFLIPTVDVQVRGQRQSEGHAGVTDYNLELGAAFYNPMEWIIVTSSSDLPASCDTSSSSTDLR